MRDIINGSKHLGLNYKPKVVASELHRGDFSNDFSRDFDISCLLITTADGRELYFEDELETAVRFWSQHPRLATKGG
jgi:hypothetical protein